MIRKLIAIRLRSTFGSMLRRKGTNGEYSAASPARLLLLGLVYAFLIGFFAIFSGSMAVSLCMTTVPYGQDVLFFAFYALLPFAAVFVLSIFETKSALFESKDTELLLALPIRPRDIVVSRVMSVLLVNYGIAAIFMVPFLGVYAAFCGKLLGVLGGLVSFVLIPLLATALSVGVGYVVARIAARVKNKTFVTMALYILFFVVYFYLYSRLLSVTGDSDDLGALGEYMASIAAGAPVLCFIGDAVMLRPLPFLALLAVTVGLSAFVFWRVSATFISVSTMHRGERRAVYIERRTLRKSPFFALARKELARFISSAVYMMNAATGLVFLILFTGVLLFADITGIQMMLTELGLSSDAFVGVIAMILVLCTLMNFISACTVSLEGKSLWLVRMLPVKASDVLLAKTVPHIVITSAFSTLCGIVLAIRLQASVGYALALVFLPLLANITSALWGVVINTALPKFDYTSEAQVVKQSMSGFLGMFVPAMLAFVMLVAVFVLSMLSLGWLALLVCGAVFVMLSALLYVLLIRVSARTFDTFVC